LDDATHFLDCLPINLGCTLAPRNSDGRKPLEFQMTKRRNFGGFSWKRLMGISAAKSRVSRAIGIPLTASGRRRKLGASIFNAVGPVAGTITVAAIEATKNRKLKADTSRPSSSRGVHFCEVKGVTHNNEDGTSRAVAQQFCSIGDTVNLVPDLTNEHDRSAIRVVLLTGQQIGFISARQAARFQDKLHLLTATIYSRVKDEWGNDTVKLRVVERGYDGHSANDLSDVVSVAQAEAVAAEKENDWQASYIYFENAELAHQVSPSRDTETLLQVFNGGLLPVGFIGLNDAPKGIKFGFSLLDESLPPDGVVAQRFLANAHDWVTTWTKYICTQRGDPAPVEHDFAPSSPLVSMPSSSGSTNISNPFGRSGTNTSDAAPRPKPLAMKFWFLVGVALVFALIFVVIPAVQRPSTPNAAVVRVNGVNVDNEAEMLISRCGQPSKDTLSDPPHSSPALTPTRIIEYRKSRLRFMFKLLSGAAVWHLVEISEIPRGNSKAHVVTQKEALARMKCWAGTT
jgi:hypothetical protein